MRDSFLKSRVFVQAGCTPDLKQIHATPSDLGLAHGHTLEPGDGLSLTELKLMVKVKDREKVLSEKVCMGERERVNLCKER